MLSKIVYIFLVLIYILILSDMDTKDAGKRLQHLLMALMLLIQKRGIINTKNYALSPRTGHQLTLMDFR